MSELKLPPLNAIKAFEAAARHGGFRAAADALNVSHGVIGRHVRLLENHLGVTLFVSKNRGVELTEDGRYYHATVSKALRMIDRATTELAEENSADFVHILAIPGLASKWLGPRMQSLSSLWPKARVVVWAGDEFEEVMTGEVDFGIGYGLEDEFPGKLEYLASPEVFPVASPDYISQKGPLDSLSDLQQADLLDEDFGEWWDFFFEEQGLISQRAARLVYPSGSQTIDAALAHQGVALVNAFLVAPELQSGALQRVTDLSATAGSYWIIRPQERPTRPMAERCIRWIKEEIQKSQNIP
ncbi:LysR substrate-binding domain-containing protein [Rhodovibrionaceae bacterium A322]